MKARVLKSKKIYTARVFTLYNEDILINGRRLNRDVIRHPGSAIMIPLLDAKSRTIIMIKQYRHAAGGELYEFPAGTRDRGETHRQCALRELTEETGYKAKKAKLLSKFFLSPGTMTEVMSMFLCTGLTKTKQAPEDDEQIKVLITTLDKAVRMVYKGAIKDAKTIAGVMFLKSLYEDGMI